MKILRTIAETRLELRTQPARGSRLGLVPTMGALHQGHLSLIQAAHQKCDVIVASVFVNPTQFGPNEDFAKYPRSFERDCELLQGERVDFVFAPSAEEMYPQENTTWVEVKGLTDRLCGKSRPGHFRGVATVVAKLFHILEPDIAFFGQKDAAQAAIICRMTRDLNFPVQIEVCPIVREPDGLAMSSRNAYLTPQQRKSAPVLYRSLMQAKELFDRGERDSAKLIAAAKKEISAEPSVQLDYFEIVNPDTLETCAMVDRQVLVAVAALVGTTRLIDNILLEA